MTLTVVIPGLLWPRQVMRDTLYGSNFPALQTLLGKGRIASSSRSVDDWWCSYFGIGQDAFAAAPLRLSALDETPGADQWLCADPVHLRIDQQGARLTDPALLNISAAEARQLHALLTPLFTNVGELIMATPSHWHIRLAIPAPAFPKHLNEFIEQPAVALLPAGDQGRAWRLLINEVQMILHTHPLNSERSAQGKATINSIALWGEGHAPALQIKGPTVLLSDDLIITGAGKLAGMKSLPLPPRFTAEMNDDIVNWDHLRFPTAHHDALGWHEGLQQLEQEWLAPALAALNDGKLKRIELYGFGEEETLSLSMTSLDRHRFWRKPRRLESL